MPVRRRGNKLERWEIALIKAMVADGRWPNDQDILAHFTRPTRSINHRAIAEIRTGTKHTAIKAAASDELDSFIASWPEVDAETGLSLRGDELLIKAREAIEAARIAQEKLVAADRIRAEQETRGLDIVRGDRLCQCHGIASWGHISAHADCGKLVDSAEWSDFVPRLDGERRLLWQWLCGISQLRCQGLHPAVPERGSRGDCACACSQPAARRAPANRIAVWRDSAHRGGAFQLVQPDLLGAT
jgi:hypothetical protein